jgi:hypothetical protein
MLCSVILNHMGRNLAVAFILAASLSMSGCAVEDQSQAPAPEPTPSVDQKLVPSAAPSNAVDVEPAKYLTSYGDIIFKVGDGPTWCTMSEYDDFVICEHKEFDAKYDPLPVPEDCEQTYGYQLRLRGSKAEGVVMAEFTCANANWSDASQAPVLASGERIEAFGFSCFVEGQTARCENSFGDYIALGPKAWALSN